MDNIISNGTNPKDKENLENRNKISEDFIQDQIKVITYRPSSSRKSNQPQPEEKESVQEKKERELKNLFSKKCLIISTIILIGIIVAVVVIVVKLKESKKKLSEIENTDEIIDDSVSSDKNDNEKKNNEEIKKGPLIISGPTITKEEAMKIFKPSFNITSKEDTLTQLLFKSTKTYNTTSNGVESSYSTFSKAKYDIYTLNSTSPGEDKDFYSTKYTTVITINSICTKLSSGSSEEDCELKKYLDLNIKNNNNLRRIDGK